MSVGDNAVNRAMDKRLCFSFKMLNNVVDASYRWNDPDFIADANFAILSDKALECSSFCLWLREGFWIIFVFQDITEVCLDVLGMDMPAIPLTQIFSFSKS